MNSNRKGKVGEREWRDVLRAEGYLKARRGMQFCGSPDSPDVVCPELDSYHFEVKRVERLNITDAMAQACSDCGDKTPVVAHRRNRGQWLVTLLAPTFFNLLRQAGIPISGDVPDNKTPGQCDSSTPARLNHNNENPNPNDRTNSL